jgi:hypothetical protein
MTAGALFMFSGAYFLHVYAGHLSLLYAVAWTPLVFASVEGWIQKRTLGWVLLGMAAIAMQIFAGDMQACFCTAVAATLLLVFDLINAPQRSKALLGFLGMYAGAAALGAVQLVATLQAAGESVRAGGVSYEFASMVSFAPENLLTLLAPGFFGDLGPMPYWGRWYWWEMCLFIGVSGLALAVYGAVYGRREHRWKLVPLVVILLILALGSNTPLFKILYRWAPGFDRFRGSAKFILEASMFLVMLAGTGLDRLLGDPRGNRWLAVGVLIAGTMVGIAALELRATARSDQPATWWTRMLQGVYSTQESYLPATEYTNPSFIHQTGLFASKCLSVAAAEFLMLGVLIFMASSSRRMGYAVPLMAVVEVFVFARSTRTTFDLSATRSPKLKAFLEQRPGDYRIFYERQPNIAVWLGKQDVWGYGPLTLKRYTEFMAFTQGQDPEGVTQYINFSRFHPLHAILRWRYAFVAGKDEDHVLTAKTVLPRLELVQAYRVISGRDEILHAMGSPSFDPEQEVILETEPRPAPTPSAKKGIVTLVDSSAGRLTIVADLPHPAILLITDAYSNGWRARPLKGSEQHVYDILPANYALLAIPLSQGRHSILLEYIPTGFREGMWISLTSLVALVFVAGRDAWMRRVRRAW